MIVLTTLGALRRPGRRRGRRDRRIEEAEPARVPTARATIVQPEPFPDEVAAGGWLKALRGDHEALDAEVTEATSVLNEVLRAHRAATADPYVREVRAEQALVRRAGYGDGTLVAEGRFAAAIEAPASTKRRRRAERLSPQERLAALLGGRARLLACEELVLRARLDLDGDRPREAALQARVALEAMLVELASEAAVREGLAELRARREDLARAANAALDGELSREDRETVAAVVERMERTLARHRVGSA